MTYSAQLGRLGAVPLSQAPRPASDPFSPPACAHLKRYRPPPATVPGNTVIVKSWPFTKASMTQVNAMLDYLTKPVRGRGEPAAARSMRAFPVAVNRLWMASPTLAGQMRIFSAGWVPDPESSSSVTIGTFWIALSLSVSKPKGWYDQQLRAFKREAMEAAGIFGTVQQNRLMANVSGTAVAGTGMNITADQLKEGAYKSALSSGEFGAFVRTTFAMPRISKTSSQIAAPIVTRAKKARDAYAVLESVGAISSGVGAVISQAYALPDPAAGVQLLVATRAQVEGAKAAIQAGVAAVPGVIADGLRIKDGILRQMSTQILAAARASITNRIGFTIAREYVMCWTLAQARRALGRQIDALLGTLIAGIQAAQRLKANASQVNLGIEQLDDLIDDLKKAERELPLSSWQRTTLGIPHWGWAAVGVVTFLGGAVGVAKLKKKKKKPKKNRRRLRA